MCVMRQSTHPHRHAAYTRTMPILVSCCRGDSSVLYLSLFLSLSHGLAPPLPMSRARAHTHTLSSAVTHAAHLSLSRTLNATHGLLHALFTHTYQNGRCHAAWTGSHGGQGATFARQARHPRTTACHRSLLSAAAPAPPRASPAPCEWAR